VYAPAQRVHHLRLIAAFIDPGQGRHSPAFAFTRMVGVPNRRWPAPVLYQREIKGRQLRFLGLFTPVAGFNRRTEINHLCRKPPTSFQARHHRTCFDGPHRRRALSMRWHAVRGFKTALAVYQLQIGASIQSVKCRRLKLAPNDPGLLTPSAPHRESRLGLAGPITITITLTT
jgi:hypothetical protein